MKRTFETRQHCLWLIYFKLSLCLFVSIRLSSELQCLGSGITSKTKWRSVLVHQQNLCRMLQWCAFFLQSIFLLFYQPIIFISSKTNKTPQKLHKHKQGLCSLMLDRVHQRSPILCKFLFLSSSYVDQILCNTHCTFQNNPSTVTMHILSVGFISGL